MQLKEKKGKLKEEAKKASPQNLDRDVANVDRDIPADAGEEHDNIRNPEISYRESQGGVSDGLKGGSRF